MDQLLSSQRLEDPSAKRGARRLPARTGHDYFVESGYNDTCT